jgi:hypothetical protein
MFGDGQQVSIVNLADYRVQANIGHRVFNLTGILPDAIGIDLTVGAGIHAFLNVKGCQCYLAHTGRRDVISRSSPLQRSQHGLCQRHHLR